MIEGERRLLLRELPVREGLILGSSRFAGLLN